jgi:tRNA 2-thiouridine synthesizing protein C
MRYLFLLRHSPYGSSMAREALDMALACAAFDQEVQLVFINDGVYQLLQHQQGQLKQKKNIAKTLDALSLYDINAIYADENSITCRHINKNNVFPAASIINQEHINRLITEADIVISL